MSPGRRSPAGRVRHRAVGGFLFALYLALRETAAA